MGPATLAVICLLLPGGCGQQIDLPPQPEPIRTPEPGTYNLRTVWDVPAPTDIVIFDIYLYVIEENKRVGAYLSKRLGADPAGLISPFEGLVNPVQLALSRGESKHIVVADSGDMQCKVYSWRGGQPIHAFTDSLWASFSGLAADDNLIIYVADAERDIIQAYDRWGGRKHLVSDYGTGSGYVIRPHGLAHTVTPSGEKLLIVADTGKNWVQRLRPDTSNVAAILEPIGLEEEELQEPMDVAAGRYGEFVFVADSGHDQVLKYLRTGAFEDTVYSAAKIADVDPPIQRPSYVCSQDSLVFVSDPVQNRIVVLQLMSQ